MGTIMYPKSLSRYARRNGIILNTYFRAHEREILNTSTFGTQDTVPPTAPNTEEQKCDFIGLPDKVSNIRPIVLHKKGNETDLEILLRENRAEVHKWNQEFWFKHNQRFYQERCEFIESMKKDNESASMMTADEMSQFYKAFLDKNWKTHLNYNIEWYKKNVALLILAFRIKLEIMFKR